MRKILFVLLIILQGCFTQQPVHLTIIHVEKTDTGYITYARWYYLNHGERLIALYRATLDTPFKKGDKILADPCKEMGRGIFLKLK